MIPSNQRFTKLLFCSTMKVDHFLGASVYLISPHGDWECLLRLEPEVSPGFQTWGLSKMDGLEGTLLLKWMIWGCPNLWKPPNGQWVDHRCTALPGSRKPCGDAATCGRSRVGSSGGNHKADLIPFSKRTFCTYVYIYIYIIDIMYLYI